MNKFERDFENALLLIVVILFFGFGIMVWNGLA